MFFVYELINQRNESEPIMEDHQVFIAVRVFARPLMNNYRASSAIFMAKRDKFTGKEDDIKQLHKDILRKNLVNNTYSFECTVKDQPLRLGAVFHPGKQASIEVTLEKQTNFEETINIEPILFK
jgi:hypothetical protein